LASNWSISFYTTTHHKWPPIATERTIIEPTFIFYSFIHLFGNRARTSAQTTTKKEKKTQNIYSETPKLTNDVWNTWNGYTQWPFWPRKSGRRVNGPRRESVGSGIFCFPAGSRSKAPVGGLRNEAHPHQKLKKYAKLLFKR